MSYKRIDLPFKTDELEPYLDKETVELHYNAHHKGYETNLNLAIENTSIANEYDTLLKLMKNYQNIEDGAIRVAVREFGGGLINHNFLWQSLKKDCPIIEGNLFNEIIKTWGSMEEFKKQLLSNCLTLFGSGWVWLVKRKNGVLKIIKTFNQDNPWFLGFTPIFGIDLWEHAYYLKHHSKRASYFENTWKLINWDFCEEQYNLLTNEEEVK